MEFEGSFFTDADTQWECRKIFIDIWHSKSLQTHGYLQSFEEIKEWLWIHQSKIKHTNSHLLVNHAVH